MVTTHPIQYQVPWLRQLAAQPGLELHVFFGMIPDAVEQGREFGVAFAWDMPLLEGYAYTVLENRASRPSLTAFAGSDTPSIGVELSRGQFDAVLVNGWGTKMALQTLWACKRLAIPCIVRGEANGLRPRSAWKRWLHARLIARYDAYLAIGIQNRDYYLAAGVAPKQIFLTPYCVDNARFGDLADAARQAESQAELRRSFGMQPERRTFLFSGKFVHKKRPADLIAALSQLASQGADDLQVLMVGDGPLREELQASSAGLPVYFTGFLNQGEIGRAYAASDCLVLPSDSGETWGLVVNEAMASGLPALVSDQVGSAVNLVQNGITGRVFPCGDIEYLAELLQSSEATQMSTQGEAARRLVTSEYTFDRVVDGVMDALAYAVSRK